QLDDIEHWMKAAHGRGEHEAVSIRTDPAFNQIRTETSVGELPGWAGGVDIARIEEDLVTGGKHRCRGPTLVVIPCHFVFGLGECRFSFFQCRFHPVGELVHGFYPGTGLVCRGVDVVVVCELGEGNERVPVVLAFVHEQPDELFQLLVDPFCLAIGLRVVGCG
ncbi:hypothetical protein M413DRAFT_72527, partial [Hebeloma cylindrosporum]